MTDDNISMLKIIEKFVSRDLILDTTTLMDERERWMNIKINANNKKHIFHIEFISYGC